MKKKVKTIKKAVRESRVCNDNSALKVKIIAKGAELPSYNYPSDVGFDLRANEDVSIFPGAQQRVRTGLVFEIPEGHVGIIRDRAGIVDKMGVHSVAGTFDPGFRGEISIMMVNTSDETAAIEKGMRIAQMITIPVTKPKIIRVDKLSNTERGEKSFGSTGLKDLIKLDKDIKKKK
jgi:dUTP pyrophosphatase